MARTPVSRFDRYSVDRYDEMLAEGGRPSPVRSDPTGYEDCAREWDPCDCHGDRICRLGSLMRWAKNSFEHAKWLRGEKETPVGGDLMRMAGVTDIWQLKWKAASSERDGLAIWREAWPLLLKCAADERAYEYERAVMDAVEAEQERRWG